MDPADQVNIRLQREEHFPREAEYPVCLFLKKDGRIFPATGLQFAQDPAEGEITETVRLPQDVAQTLFDDMVKAGFRPTGKPNIEGIIGAKQAHIDHLHEALMTVLGKPSTP